MKQGVSNEVVKIVVVVKVSFDLHSQDNSVVRLFRYGGSQCFINHNAGSGRYFLYF